MKNIIKDVLLVIIFVVVLLCVIFFIKFGYNDLMKSENIEIISTLPIIDEEEKKNQNVVTIGSNNNLKLNSNYDGNNYNKNFFYQQLTERQKIIYNGLYNNKDNLKQGDYIVNYDKKFDDLLSTDDGEKNLGSDYQSAIEAFIHDNPDLFYLDINKMYLNIETTTRFFKTNYKVYIGTKDGIKYYSDDFNNLSEIEQAIIEIENEKNKILNKVSGSDYKKIKYIHDYLINSIEYDNSVEEIGTYNIYGALVNKKCVCEGYAKAFKYLTNCAGLECELVQGIGINSSGNQENHEWNCIKVNGIWYYIDCTWDDPIIIGGNGKATQSMKYKYFLKGSNTFEKDHIISNQFSEGGKLFAYPSIDSKDYNK